MLLPKVRFPALWQVELFTGWRVYIMDHEISGGSERRSDLLPEVKDIASADRDLLKNIHSGDSSAFVTLYERHKQGVYLYCKRFLGATPRAEDVFQDVFLKFLEHAREGKEIDNVRGYLMAMAHNRCLNVIRDRKYPSDISEMEDLLPAEEVSYGETHDLQKALDALPAGNREALLLREYQGYSYEEIAQLTSVPLTTVRKRIFRARQQLRTLLSTNDTNRGQEDDGV
jgi:RNA polymerase sigma-70 factor (ECF subfamily)